MNSSSPRHGTLYVIGMASRLQRVVSTLRAEMRASDWAFYGATHAAILATISSACLAGMYLIGPPTDDASVRYRQQRQPHVIHMPQKEEGGTG